MIDHHDTKHERVVYHEDHAAVADRGALADLGPQHAPGVTGVRDPIGAPLTRTALTLALDGTLHRGEVLSVVEWEAVRVLLDTHPVDGGPVGDVGILRRLFVHWIHLAEDTSPTVRMAVIGAVAYELAALAAAGAVRAACGVRELIVADPVAARPAVEAFAARWLAIAPGSVRMDAVEEALLQMPFGRAAVREPEAKFLERLNREIRYQRRAWKPLHEIIAGRGPIGQLDPIVDTDDRTPITLGQRLGAHDLYPCGLENWHPRIDDVLHRLHPDERRVILLWARTPSRIAWEEAAARCGLPPTFGRRVSARLRRAGALHAWRARHRTV